MANVADRASLAAIGEELADRFGPLPRPVEDFVRIMGLRPALKALAVESLKAADGTVALRFHEDAPIDRNELVRLATERAHVFRLRPGGVFTMTLGTTTWDAMVDEIERLLDGLVARLQPRATRGQEDVHARIS
jgi:transcription-repair coupling factor (superfamily II helicase)